MAMSWVNFTMDLATIPSTEPKPNQKTNDNADEEMHISPEDEAAELRKDLGL